MRPIKIPTYVGLCLYAVRPKESRGLETQRVKMRRVEESHWTFPMYLPPRHRHKKINCLSCVTCRYFQHPPWPGVLLDWTLPGALKPYDIDVTKCIFLPSSNSLLLKAKWELALGHSQTAQYYIRNENAL